MKFQKTVDVWNMSGGYKSIKPGQWVKAGPFPDAAKGVFCGVKKSGTVVVAWYENAKSAESYRDYVRTLMDYAKS